MIEAYTEALGIRPCSIDSLNGRARSYRFVGRPEAELEDLRESLDCRPGKREAAGLLVDALVRAESVDEAERETRRLFESPELEKRLAQIYMAQDRPARAVSQMKSVVESHPLDAAGWRSLGAALAEQDRLQRALEAYRSAAEIEPDDTDSLYWIGQLARRLDRLDEAEESFDRLVELEPASVSALLGLARVLGARGDRAQALRLTDRALAVRRTSSEARVLRASLLARMGQSEPARLELRTTLESNYASSDARVAIDRLGSRHELRTTVHSSSSRLIEGLEDEGLVSNGRVIRPTRVEYLREGVSTEVDSKFREGLGLRASLSRFREAIFNLDRNTAIYDFDIVRSGVGVERRLSDRWDLDLRLGATRYEARLPGSIEDETHLSGGVQMVRQGPRSRLGLGYTRTPFIYRGFADDTSFRIFERGDLALDYERRLSSQVSFFAAGAVHTFDDGNQPASGALGLEWSRGRSSLRLRMAHEPFPKRFLNDRSELDFIDYDSASLRGATLLGHPSLELSGELRVGTFGATSREAIVNGEIVSAGFARNDHELLQARLQWSPRRNRAFRTGLQYLYEDFQFDTGDYNNRDRSDWLAFVELFKPIGGRAQYRLRYAHGLLDDERKDGYRSDELSSRLEVRLGGATYRDQSVWLGFEGLRRENDLGEDRERYRVYLRVPIGSAGARAGLETMDRAKVLDPVRQVAGPEPLEIIVDAIDADDPDPPRLAAGEPLEPLRQRVDVPLSQATSTQDRRAVVESFLTSWAAAWSAQDVESHLARYADAFLPAGASSRAQWEATRRQRLTQPGYILVEIGEVKIRSLADDEAVLRFHQVYRSDRYSDQSEKELRLAKVEGDWRIEEEMADLLATPLPELPAAEIVDIATLVSTWQSAWMARDSTAYLAHYARDFRPRYGISRDAWASLRRERLDAPASIDLEIGVLRIVSQGDGLATVHFHQRYESDLFRDVVAKSLTLAQDHGVWRIVREATAPVGGRS